MKRILAIAFAALMGCAAWAQSQQLNDIVKWVDSYRIKAEFSCKVATDGAPIDCKGTALCQDDKFALKAAGLEIYCDGKQLVVLDPEEKEAYIQDASGLMDTLKDSMGAVSDLQVQELRFLDKSEDYAPFKFDTKKLGKEWTVTDMR